MGFAISMVLLVLFTSLTVWNFQKAAQEVKSAGKLFEERQVRSGFAATTDMQRLIYVLTEALARERIGEADRRALREAADYLFVRADTMDRRRNDGVGARYLRIATMAMRDIVGRVDEELAKPEPDIRALVDYALPRSDAARHALLRFLDEVRLSHDKVIERHQIAFLQQSASLWAFLCALVAISAASLLLLRREVGMRKDLQEAESAAQFLAYHDALTGLPNRLRFQETVEAMLARSDKVALLFVDLDRFKQINDGLGHAAGDLVLRAVADRLAAAVEVIGGEAARLSGDEFAAVLPTTNLCRIEAICGALLEEVRRPVVYESETITPGVSIGVATSEQLPGDLSLSFSSLARVADFALYSSKAMGRGRYSVFDVELEANFTERRLLIEDLPCAIHGGRLEVHFQPKVDLRADETIGFEALVRWPRNGKLVPPEQFIQLAEESGLVVEVDLFVIREATRIMADWNRRSGVDYSVSVNLSALHFTSAGIVVEVGRALRDSGLPPDLLILEITETVELRDWSQVKAVLAALRKLGCRISIDDFGTGYSSLAYLQAIGADELKIDRSLVAEVETSSDALHVLDCIVALARSLHLHIVAEGVETRAQAALLRGIGCEIGQGYHFGAPLPAQEALAAAARAAGAPALAAS